jgi:hypothetical protein
MKTNQVSATIMLFLTIGVSSLIGFGSQSAHAASECEVAFQQAQDLDARNRSIISKIKSKQIMLTSALDNREDNIAVILAGDIKVYMISYLGLVIEQRSMIKSLLENGISDRCEMDKPTLQKFYYETFDLEKEYTSRIAEITKSLNDVSNTNTEPSTKYTDL